DQGRPLYPRERICFASKSTSAKCHSRTLNDVRGSLLPLALGAVSLAVIMTALWWTRLAYNIKLEDPRSTHADARLTSRWQQVRLRSRYRTPSASAALDRRHASPWQARIELWVTTYCRNRGARPKNRQGPRATAAIIPELSSGSWPRQDA